MITSLGHFRPSLAQGGLTWVPLPHWEGITRLGEDRHIVVDVL